MSDIGFQCEPVSSVDAVDSLWRRLETEETSFFVSQTWIGTWLRCLPEHVRPLLLTATRNGEAIGAAILVSRSERRRGVLNVRQLQFNSTGDPALDCIWTEHNDFVGSVSEKRMMWPTFLRWFSCLGDADELLVPRAAEAVIGEPPPDTKLLHAMSATSAFRGVLLPGGAEALLATFSGNTRRQLQRSLSACEKLGELRCETANSVAAALDWFAALKALHVTSWEQRGKPHGFRYPFAEQFHRTLIERGVPEGTVQLLRMSAGSMILGYLYNFRCGRTIFAYQSGFDYGHSELKPGYVAHLLAMVASAAEGATRYDFLAGGDQLKHSLGRERYTLYFHRFAKPKFGLRIEAGFRSARNRLGL